MHIAMIAAIGKRNEIGLDNKLLWDIKEDMDWFKAKTKNKVIIMGRKTYESIGKPLKGRINVVLTRDRDYNPHPDVLIRYDIFSILMEFRNELELMVIGGENVYRQFLPHANRLYLTEVNQEFDADAYFPEFDREQWSRYFSVEGTEDVGFYYDFNVYKKKLIIEGMKNNDVFT